MSDDLIPLNGLETDERDWVVQQLALRKSLREIKDDFDYIFAPKQISGREILDIQNKYPDLIIETSRRELSNIAANALAHVRIRMDYILKGLRAAEKERVVQMFHYTDTNGERQVHEEKDMNHAAVAKYLQLAQQEEYLAKKLLIEVRKLDMDVPETRRSGFKPIKINVGDETDFEDVEGEVVE